MRDYVIRIPVQGGYAHTLISASSSLEALRLYRRILGEHANPGAYVCGIADAYSILESVPTGEAH